MDGFLHLRTLTPREELSLSLDMIELERVWVGVEFDSLLLVAELVRATRPAAMAIRENFYATNRSPGGETDGTH